MTVRVVFSRRHHIGTVLLRAFLWSRWSHCAIVDADEVVEATAMHGVQCRPLAALLAESSEYEIVEFPARDPAKVIAAARAQIGAGYDWLGVLGIGFRRRWQGADTWFCSELVAHAFHAAGEPLVRVDAWRITPRDLYLPTYFNNRGPHA
ncbi:MAG: YiiX/YebB-like N1pC/P60 family cysteine hydrolase [Lysobacter sp.]